jgi:capsular exopolysaccharide synthesis family protein
MSFNRYTFRDYVRMLFRHKGLMLLTFLSVVLSVYFGLQLQTPIYQAEVKILISGTKESGAVYYKNMGVDDTEIANTQSELVTSTPVLSQVVKTLHLDDLPLDYEAQFASPFKRWFIQEKAGDLNARLYTMPEADRNEFLYQHAIEVLRSKIQVELLRYTNLLAVRVQDFDPKEAAIIANVLSRSYVIFDLQQQQAELQLKYGERHPIIQQLKDNIAAMQTNLTGAPLSEIEAIGPATVKIIEQAMPPLRPLNTPKNMTLLAAIVLGAFLSIVFAVMLEYMDQSIKTPRDAEHILKIPALGSISRKRWWQRLICKNIHSRSFYAKNYQSLAEQIMLLKKDKSKVLLFVSTENREGTSSIVANTGFLLANYSNKKVLMIDLNLRKPTLHSYFGYHRNPGFVDVFEKEETFEDVIHDVSPYLKILTAGRNGFNPSRVINSDNIGEFLKNYREQYDYILLDCANLKSYKDAAALSNYVDGVVLVISENRTNRHTVQSVINSFNQVNPKIIGFVFNKRTFAIPQFIYERV